MKIYDTPAMSLNDGQQILGSTQSLRWAHAAMAGMLTTRQLFAFFLNESLAPDNLVDSCRALQASLRHKIGSSEAIAERCWRWGAAAPDVEHERAWLPAVEHFIDRAVVARDYWNAHGGPQALAKSHALKATPPLPPPHHQRIEQPLQIELKPIITLQLPDAPLPVVVKSMPTRIKTTEINRNGAGDIISSMQIETDAPTDQEAT